MNPVVIIATALSDPRYQISSSHKHNALAIIAALEAAGKRIVDREPTEEMVERARLAMADAPPGEELCAALKSAHDAAPRYGELETQLHGLPTSVHTSDH